MNRPEIYNRSVRALTKAYMNDTLHAFSCAACALGNIIAEANGYNISIIRGRFVWTKNGKRVKDDHEAWGKFLHMIPYKGEPLNGQRQIKSTGYTPNEALNLERAFMNKWDADDQYNALIAVVDYLGEIHKADEETTEKSKKMLKQPA